MSSKKPSATQKVGALALGLGLLSGVAAGCSLLNGSAIPSSGTGSGVNASSARPVAYVYTTLYSKNAVMEIDANQSRALTDPIIVPNGPRALAVDPRGRSEYLYVVCELGNTVAVVDRRNRQVIRSINVGQQPYAIAVSPNGQRAFVTNQGDDTVSILDLTCQTVVATVPLNVATGSIGAPVGTPTAAPVRFQPRGIAVNAAGTRAYVACRGGFMVVLEGAAALTSQCGANGQIGGVITGGQAAGQAWTAVRNLPLTGAVAPLNVAVSGTAETGEIAVVTDPQAGRIFTVNSSEQGQPPQARQMSGGPWGVAIAPATANTPAQAFVTLENSNALMPLSLPDMSPGNALSTEGLQPQSVLVAPQGDTVYVSLTGSNNVGIFRRGQGGVVERPQVFNLNQLNPSFIAPTGELALAGFLAK